MADIDAHLRALTEYKDDMLKRETPLPKASAACPVCGVDRPHGHGQEELITLIVRLRSDHEAALKAAVAAEREALIGKIALAYGHLWHVNNEPAAPLPIYTPEKAAYEARKILRDTLTSEQRGDAINATQQVWGGARGADHD